MDDHEVNKHDTVSELRRKIEEIYVRWGDKQEQGAIRYIIESVVDDDEYEKARIISGAAYAWGISVELSKFFYNWVLMELRDIMFNKVFVGFTEQDLFRAANSYNHLPDLLNIVTFDQMKKMIAVMGGARLKIPTLTQMGRLVEDYKIHRDIDNGDKDPDSVDAVAKKYGRSSRNASDVFSEMTEVLNANRYGEYELYE